MSEREEHGNKVCEILDSIWRELSEMLRELINRNVEIPNALRVALDGAKILKIYVNIIQDLRLI
ncbi:MAG: hypothetical protein QXG93_06185 [Nitrososphaerota archaeon]